MSDHCTIEEIDGQSCVVCPEVLPVAAVPSQVITDPALGWNAGARSVVRMEGDCYVQFSAPRGAGTVVGLAHEHKGTHPRDVPHGFYLYEGAGANWWRIVESGKNMTAPVLRAADTDKFRIERRGSTVRYFHNGKQVYVSAVPQQAPNLIVVACLYAAEDKVN